MSQAASIPELHRSLLNKFGCSKRFEEWLKDGRAVIVEDVIEDERNEGNN